MEREALDFFETAGILVIRDLRGNEFSAKTIRNIWNNIHGLVIQQELFLGQVAWARGTEARGLAKTKQTRAFGQAWTYNNHIVLVPLRRGVSEFVETHDLLAESLVSKMPKRNQWCAPETDRLRTYVRTDFGNYTSNTSQSCVQCKAPGNSKDPLKYALRERKAK